MTILISLLLAVAVVGVVEIVILLPKIFRCARDVVHGVHHIERLLINNEKYITDIRNDVNEIIGKLRVNTIRCWEEKRKSDK